MPFGNYLELTDPKVMRALAHPARTAILMHLQDGPATATECAEVVGDSPSACSYHLRQLARYGFVEEVESDDGRERRWRAAVSGYGVPKEAQDRPEVLAAMRPLTRRWFEDNQQVIGWFLATEPRFEPVWRKAATFHTSAPYLTPDELIRLGEQVQELIEPFCVEPTERPPGAVRVHVSFVGVPWPAKRKKAGPRRGRKTAEKGKGRASRG